MSKPTRYFSKRQENIIAKQTGGKRQANSGATAFAKGDVVTAGFLIEAKTCVKEQKSFTIQKEWIKKNEEEAFAMKKSYSALAFDFGDGEQHYVISAKLFNILQEALNEETP